MRWCYEYINTNLEKTTKKVDADMLKQLAPTIMMITEKNRISKSQRLNVIENLLKNQE